MQNEMTIFQLIGWIVGLAVSATVLVLFFITLGKWRREVHERERKEQDRIKQDAYNAGFEASNKQEMKNDLEKAFVKIRKLENVARLLSRMAVDSRNNFKMTQDSQRQTNDSVSTISREVHSIGLIVSRIAQKVGVSIDNGGLGSGNN